MNEVELIEDKIPDRINLLMDEIECLQNDIEKTDYDSIEYLKEVLRYLGSYLSISEAAYVLDLSERTVRRYIKEGYLETYRSIDGRMLLIPASSIKQFIEKTVLRSEHLRELMDAKRDNPQNEEE